MFYPFSIRKSKSIEFKLIKIDSKHFHFIYMNKFETAKSDIKFMRDLILKALDPIKIARIAMIMIIAVVDSLPYWYTTSVVCLSFSVLRCFIIMISYDMM